MQGDVGGPLYCSVGPMHHITLSGVIAYEGTGSKDLPTIYTRVSGAYVDWINCMIDNGKCVCNCDDDADSYADASCCWPVPPHNVRLQ